MKSHAANLNQPHKGIVDRLELPKDVFHGLPLLSMEGNRTLCVVNHRGLVCYTCEKIVIATKEGSIQVSGRNLEIGRFDGDFLEVSGVIQEVLFL